MSQVKIQGNVSGTGTFTIAAPNSNSDRTLNLPDGSGTINTSGAPNEVPAGSASAPAIYPTGDTNTGIFFPAADTIAFAEGGVEVARFNSSGNFDVPASITTATQAVKTANTTVATTAFVDRLRSLLAPTTGSGGGTAVIGDRGALLSVTGGVTIPNAVFAANDVFTIYNNSASNITITQGASLTLRQVGTANTGNRTLAQRGLATVVFISSSEAVISGGGLT